MTNVLLQTIETDLAAGESFLEQEALGAGLWLWNLLKTAFIALGPAEVTILSDTLTGAVNDAAGGKSIEQIETDAMNTATSEQKSVLVKAGSNAVQTVIAALKNKVPPPATVPAS